jgi:hypothetical protein
MDLGQRLANPHIALDSATEKKPKLARPAGSNLPPRPQHSAAQDREIVRQKGAAWPNHGIDALRRPAWFVNGPKRKSGDLLSRDGHCFR